MSYVFTSHNTSILFIHIPKTGGKSIFAYLQDSMPNCSIFKKEHGTVEYFIKNNIKFSYSFTVVRNPYDRVVSFYKELYRIITDRDLNSKLTGFAIDLKDWQKGLDFFIHEILLQPFFKDFTQPQINYITYKNKTRLQDILYFENIHSDLRKLSIDTPLKNKTLPHLGAGTIVKEQISESGKKIINNFYKEDFRFLGYEFR